MSDDHSIFAWLESPTGKRQGPLAEHPKNFCFDEEIVPLYDWKSSAPYAVTNKGLQIQLPLIHISPPLSYYAVLGCRTNKTSKHERVRIKIERSLSGVNQYHQTDNTHLYTMPLDLPLGQVHQLFLTAPHTSKWDKYNYLGSDGTNLQLLSSPSDYQPYVLKRVFPFDWVGREQRMILRWSEYAKAGFLFEDKFDGLRLALVVGYFPSVGYPWCEFVKCTDMSMDLDEIVEKQISDGMVPRAIANIDQRFIGIVLGRKSKPRYKARMSTSRGLQQGWMRAVVRLFQTSPHIVVSVRHEDHSFLPNLGLDPLVTPRAFGSVVSEERLHLGIS